VLEFGSQDCLDITMIARKDVVEAHLADNKRRDGALFTG
jgi:hypothetical protein